MKVLPSSTTISLVLLLVALTGCDHGEPYQPYDPHPGGPFVPSTVALLTYSPGRDQSAEFSTRGILYTFEDLNHLGRPWCLGILPAAGGSRTSTWCDSRPDSNISYDWGVEGPGGQLAYTRAAGLPFARSPVTWWVMVSPDGRPATGIAVSPVVFGVPGGQGFQGAEQLRWLDSLHLVWVAARRVVGGVCKGCPDDTLQSGRNVVLLNVTQPGVPSVLPGTDYATSVTVRGTDEVFFTRGGDARVYRQVVSSGMTTAVWDFGAAGTVRDIQLRGDTLVGIIGGNVTFAFDSVVGDTVQVDSGGTVVLLDFATGAQQLLSTGQAVRHPSLSSDGRQVVVQSAAQPENVYLVTLP